MLTVEDYARIRLAHRDGMSIRAIARKYHRSRRKIREMLRESEPRGYIRCTAPSAPKLGPYMGLIEEILKADESAPRKQRHTAAQIFRRLAQEGYAGSYDQVRRYVARHRRQTAETFLPLSHSPGQRAEADFGHIYVDFPTGRRRVAVLLVTWAYSYRPFVMALPSERVEAILHGMRSAFEFFACVPREVWWDNPTTVATAILVGRKRLVQARYWALASHYQFEPLFCMPARGNEKPHVENRVKDLQRRWATPVPTAANLSALNDSLRGCCLKDLDRVATGQSETIGARFQQDRAAALALPERGFDACISESRKIDKYHTVAFDTNRYSVPRSYAFQSAWVKGYTDTVEIVVEGQVVARHQRSYETRQHILDPLHYLSILGRKPAYLDHTAVFRDWKLPASFGQLREQLQQQHGPIAGARHFIRVLQLLGEHPLARVREAIERSGSSGRANVDRIIQRTEQLRRCQSEFTAPLTDGAGAAEEVPQVRVPRPNLKCFDQFLSPGGVSDVKDDQSFVAVEDEPEATAAAHHAVGV